jgi:MSHA biogenesis protein MshQ
MSIQNRRSSYLIVCLLWVLSIFSSAALGVTEQVRVSANNDDAEELIDDGDMYIDSSDLEFGYDDFAGGLQIVGMRFSSVDIPQGATITSAYIEFETDETDSGTTNLVIFGEDVDSPNQFGNNDNISDRTKTSDATSVNWTPSAWNTVDELHQTPDISAIIQEIVDRSGWAANNNLVIIIEPGSGCNSDACQRTAESHDGEPNEAPLLVVDYTVAGSGDSNLTGSMNVDNAFSAYISTDDSVQGTLIGSGNNWPTTVDIAATLTEGQDYYLHIYATDAGGVAGFLGNFELSGTGHTFSNGLTTLNTDTVNWSVSTSDWSNYQAASSYGVNGTSTWGTQENVDVNAEWIWSSDNNGDNINYFSTTISAAATPSNSCATYFPDSAQGNTASSFIRFKDTSRLIAEPDSLINFPSINDQASGFTCTTVDCSSTNSPALALTLPTFETTSTNADISVSSGISTIGSGGTFSQNEIDVLTISGSANITFLASPDNYVITDATFSGSSVVTFNEGEYWFDSLKIEDSTQVIINGAVTIYLNDHSDIEGSSRVNEAGPAKNLAIVAYDKLHFKGSVEVHAVIYGGQVDGSSGEEIKLEDTVRLFGAVSASGKLELKNSATITYEDISDVTIGSMCGGASPLELQSVSSACSSLQNVTIVFNNDVEQSSAETVNNYQITNPSGNSISINSAARSPANTVTLSLAATLNDLTEYTVTINNVQDTNGGLISSGTTSSLSLSCNLNCLSDQFAGPGSLGSSWSASSSNGSFGTPRIVENGRLRLTDNSGQVATVATLLNQFPGAGNKIEIEFDYYSYGGSGADGIAVTFSDASISPVPGSYGGALGYAQRSGGTPGFAGGWLGIGIDEYGNFANPNEGKDGGSGFEQDSIALRGSGVGVNGYPYLTSTGTLSPGIDESGSTANPGHRYRVSIDHTMGGLEAYVAVARDTGSGFVEVIPRFDIYSVNPSQAVVPSNWVVSFTGSTGGSTNIHEIGAFEVCAALPIELYGSPDHYHISHNSPGVTCEGSDITITAHDAAHAAFKVTSDTNITVTTNPAIDNIITSPVTMLKDSSIASFSLNQSVALANIDIDVTDGTASDLDDGGDEDELFEFLDTAFRFYADSNNTDGTPIGSQISGKPSNIAPGNQSLALRAVRTNTDTGACEAALQGTTTVDIAYECNNPTTCTANDLLTFVAESTETISPTDNGASLGYTSVDMEFDASGEAPFFMNYLDAGQITLHARKSVDASDPDPAFELIGLSNAFVVRPFGFDLDFDNLREDDWLDGLTLNGSDGNTSYAEDHNGSVYIAAGVDFDMQITAVNWALADDANNDGVPDSGANLSDNSATANFGQETTASTLALTHSLIQPAGEAPGTLSSTTVIAGDASSSFSNGVASATLSWDEVGIIDITSSHENYLGVTGGKIEGTANNVGRFIPHHLKVNKNDGAFAPACGIFSYIGQWFTYQTEPSLTIVAENEAGGVTENYTHPDYQKLTVDNSNITRDFPTEDIEFGKNLSDELTVETTNTNGVFDAIVTAGELLYTFNSSDSFTYEKNINSEVGSFDSDLTISITKIEDSDGAQAPSITPAAPLLINPTAINIRYGRFIMKNAFGPETDDLAMEAYVEYLSDAITGVYLLNSADSCTNLSSTISMTPAGTTGAENHGGIPVGSGTGTSDFSYNSPLSGGKAGFLFTAPGAGEDGEIGVNVDLLTFPWLQYNWNGNVAGSLQNPPSTTTMFGQYRGHDRIIYWREIQ